jgi:hypothetical protein
MLIELACISILYKCGKRLLKNNKPVTPKNFQPETASLCLPAKIADEELTDAELGKKYGFLTYDEEIKRNLRRKVKKEMWKEMGIED